MKLRDLTQEDVGRKFTVTEPDVDETGTVYLIEKFPHPVIHLVNQKTNNRYHQHVELSELAEYELSFVKD